MNPYDLPLDDSPPADIERNRGPRAEYRVPLPAVSVLRQPTLTLLRQPTAQAVIDFFVRNDGLGEEPDGSNNNWVTRWFGMRDAWCAMACYRAALEAGFTVDDETVTMPGVAQRTPKGSPYVPEVASHFVDAGMYGDEPRPGSFGICRWPESGSWVDPFWGMPGDHICVVEYVADDGSIVTRDGNVSNSIGQRRRSRDLYHGFCYPPYATTEEDDMATPWDPKGNERDGIIADLATGWADLKAGRQQLPQLNAIEGDLAKLKSDIGKLRTGGGGGTIDEDALVARITASVLDGLKARL